MVELKSTTTTQLDEALSWVGFRLDDLYGAGIGKVESVYIDAEDQTPQWLLTKQGRFGGNHVLVPLEDAAAGAGHVWVPYERDLIKAAPDVPAGPLTLEAETTLCRHFGAARRMAALEGRAQDGETARPA